MRTAGTVFVAFLLCFKRSDTFNFPERDDELMVPVSIFLLEAATGASINLTITYPVKNTVEYIETSVCPELLSRYGSQVSCDVITGKVLDHFDSLSTWVPIGSSYLDTVRTAVNDDNIFDTFKKNDFYTSILEHSTIGEGFEYLESVATDNPSWLSDIEFLRRLGENNNVGSPSLYDFSVLTDEALLYIEYVDSFLLGVLPPGHSTFSPSTMRYLGVLSNIRKKLFDNAKDSIFSYNRVIEAVGIETVQKIMHESFPYPANMRKLRVGEIGVGYGGQAQAMFSLLYDRVEVDYYFIDLPDVLLLVKKYLNYFTWIKPSSLHFNAGITRVFNSKESNTLSADYGTEVSGYHEWKGHINFFDLCYSNYAFSEFSREVQLKYIDQILRYCERGYMLYNHVGRENHSNSLTMKEFGTALLEAYNALGVAINVIVDEGLLLIFWSTLP
jgi:hypothetical protein